VNLKSRYNAWVIQHQTSLISSILVFHPWNCRRAEISAGCFGLATKYISEKVQPLNINYSIFETAQLCQSKIDMTRLNSIHTEEHDGTDDVDIETGDDDLRQLNYDC
jgi:hypothetical protein